MMFMCSRKGYSQFKDEKDKWLIKVQYLIKRESFGLLCQTTENLVKFSSFEACCGPVPSQGLDR